MAHNKVILRYIIEGKGSLTPEYSWRTFTITQQATLFAQRRNFWVIKFLWKDCCRELFRRSLRFTALYWRKMSSPTIYPV